LHLLKAWYTYPNCFKKDMADIPQSLLLQEKING
jgi:hypothetical protein